MKNRYHVATFKDFWGKEAAGVLPICIKTKRCLVGLRSFEVNEPHTWGVFGGKFDNDLETPEEVADREFREETCYEGEIELIKIVPYKKDGFVYHNFIGLVEEEFTPILDVVTSEGIVENEDARWIDFDKLMMLPKKHFGLIYVIQTSVDALSQYMK